MPVFSIQEILVVSLIVTSFLATVGAVFLYKILRSRSSWRDLAQDVLMSNEWKVFRLEPALRTLKHRHEIVVSFSGARYHLEENRIILSDGTVVVPEVEAAGGDGVWQQLPLIGGYIHSIDAEIETASADGIRFELPKFKEGGFVALRIRSAHVTALSRIRWREYNLK